MRILLSEQISGGACLSLTFNADFCLIFSL